jgi:hypothetical protein
MTLAHNVLLSFAPSISVEPGESKLYERLASTSRTRRSHD